MLTIWKFPVPISDLFTIKMPEGSRLLSVQVQGNGGAALIESMPERLDYAAGQLDKLATEARNLADEARNAARSR